MNWIVAVAGVAVIIVISVLSSAARAFWSSLAVAVQSKFRRNHLFEQVTRVEQAKKQVEAIEDAKLSANVDRVRKLAKRGVQQRNRKQPPNAS